MSNNSLTASLLRIERTSIHDGQGLRTVLFLKGCPLRCQWCSTPESQNPNPELGYIRNKCLGCGTCVHSCPEKALSMSEDGRTVIIDHTKCTSCFICVEKCPYGALKKYGSYISVQEAIREIAKDEIFFFHSGGGVTFSGGEPLNHPDFVSKVMRECGMLGIHTSMETSLFAPFESIEKILPWLNVLYVDLKHMDSESHKKFVGSDNSLIHRNIRKVDESNYPLEIIVRIPVIPGINDSLANLEATAQFCRSFTKLKGIELLPYHRLGTETYKNLDRDYTLKDLVPQTREWMLEKVDFLKQQSPGVPVRLGSGLEATPDTSKE